MNQIIICPNCFKEFRMETIGKVKEVFLQGFCKTQQGIYAPREKFLIGTHELKERVDFLFRNWQNIVYVVVSDESGKEIRRFTK